MKKLLLTLILTGFLTACANNNANTTYSNADIGQQSMVEMGKIIQMTPVETSGSDGLGTLAGAGAGAAAGSMIGGNTAVNIIGGIGGALIGGMVGSATERGLTKTKAYNFIIQRPNGSYTSLVQTNELNLRPGDNVWLTRSGNKTRIQSRANYN